jgi:heat shock protein HspQ
MKVAMVIVFLSHNPLNNIKYYFFVPFVFVVKKMKQGPLIVEKSQFVDQNISTRFERLQAFILDNRPLFATTGAVVASWRYYRKKRLGPFYRLAYRNRNRQCSIYLGRSQLLAEKVRLLLADIQFRRISRRLRSQIRASLRLHKIQLKNTLLACGYYMKGYEIHKPKKSRVSFHL